MIQHMLNLKKTLESYDS